MKHMASAVQNQRSTLAGLPASAAGAGLVLLVAGALLSAACSRGNPEGEARPRPAPAATAAAEPAARDVKVLDSADKLLFRLEAVDKGYRVLGEGDKLQALLVVQADRVKVEDAEGKPLLTLKHQDKKCKAEDESGKELFSLKPHSTKAGDYKLEAAGGALLYRLKKEDYGYKVTDAQDQTLFKMKLDAAAGRVVADGPDGKKRMVVKGSSAALAATAVALESFDMTRRAALYAYLARFEGGR